MTVWDELKDDICPALFDAETRKGLVSVVDSGMGLREAGSGKSKRERSNCLRVVESNGC